MNAPLAEGGPHVDLESTQQSDRADPSSSLFGTCTEDERCHSLLLSCGFAAQSTGGGMTRTRRGTWSLSSTLSLCIAAM